jgi:glutaredoxin 3
MDGKNEDGNVIVYSTTTCPHCTSAKGYLESKGVKFIDYDVSKDQKRAQEMVTKSGQGGVPVLQINGRIIVGFDRHLIDDALGKKPPLRREVALGNIIYDLFSK